MEIKKPKEIKLFKASDNVNFHTMEAAEKRELELAFSSFYKSFSLVWEGSQVSSDKMQGWLLRYRDKIEEYYKFVDEQKE